MPDVSVDNLLWWLDVDEEVWHECASDCWNMEGWKGVADFIGYINFEDWPSIYTIDDALTAVKDTLDKVLPEDLAHVFGTAWERRMRKIEVLNTVR